MVWSIASNEASEDVKHSTARAVSSLLIFSRVFAAVEGSVSLEISDTISRTLAPYSFQAGS